MFLKNPNGQIVGVNDEAVPELLKNGFNKIEDESLKRYLEKTNRFNKSNLSKLSKSSKSLELNKNSVLIKKELNDSSIYLLSSVDRPDGYGQTQEFLIKYLPEYGVKISKSYNNQRVGLCYYTPVFSSKMKTPVKVIYTMFESSTIPSSWVKELRKADRVIVPSKFCQDIFATRGINTTIVPLGYNSDVYRYIKRDKHDVFTFLHYNAFNVRKGFDLVFKAFTEEFKVDEPVKMIFKTVYERTTIPILKGEYPNIDVIRDTYNHKQMIELLGSADAFVFPSRGEGFGLTPLEALATGLPVLIPNASGMSEYFDSKYFYEIDIAGKCPALYSNYPPSDVGTMIEPDLESLKKQMRYVFEHQDEAREKGKDGAMWVKNNWTARQSIKKLSIELKKVINNDQVIDKDIPDIAFLTEDISFYSGGRYHSWLQALMLSDSKYRVVVYTNETPVFLNDFDLYEQPEIVRIGHPDDTIKSKYTGALAFNDLDIEAGAYFGSPATASLSALRLGLKYKKPVYITMFDPPSWVENSDVCTKDELKRDFDLKEYINANRKDVEALPDFKIIVLTENSINDWAQWYGLDKKYFVAHHPAVNSRIIELFNRSVARPRSNSIVTCSRNHPRKGFLDVLSAFKPYSRDHVLHIITHDDKGIVSKIEALDIPKDKVTIHLKISDVEKFRLLSQSKCLLSGSRFEGFGMWSIEARAMGIPVVCYDLPAIKDIYNDKGMYKAKCFDIDQLRTLLGNAIGAEPIEPKTDHYFEVCRDKLLDVVRPDIVTCDKNIIPMFIVLNEHKYLNASLRAVLKRKEVKKVIIVEGADKKYPNASADGLSTDETKGIIDKLVNRYKDRIIYERMGWVEGKERLRQRCLELAEYHNLVDWNTLMTWGLFVDGDEVWSDEAWKELVSTIRSNKKSGVILFKHLHFWKKSDLLAVGSQWDSRLFRCFRFAEKGLEIKQHASEPRIASNQGVGDKYGVVINDFIKLHHYGAMKDDADIKDKLDFYRTRDTKLNVVDTWTDWKEGNPTQWTAGGGSVIKYEGTHPREVKNIICNQWLK